MLENKVSVCRKAGGSIINHAPAFSYGNRTVYVGCGSILKSFSTDTGEHVQDFVVSSPEGEEIEENIVTVTQHPFDRNALLCGFEDGNFITWSTETNSVINCVKVQVANKVESIRPYVTNYDTEKFNIVAAVKCEQNDSKIMIKLFSYIDGTCKYSFGRQFDSGKHTWSVATSESWKTLAVIKRDHLTIVDLDTCAYKGKDIVLTNKRFFTCVTCHPSEETIAAGDNTGRVIVYYVADKNVLDRVPFCIYHWHTLPVNDIAFSPSGSMLYSGGSEQVLVKWKFNASEIRHFLPRLPAPIVHITVALDNEYVALSTTDNGIIVIDTQQHIRCILQQFSWGSVNAPEQPLFPIGLIVDQRSKCIVTNGRPGHLQFYSPLYSSLVYNLDVTEQNYVARERQQVVANFEVIAAQFSSDGVWLVTSQIRDDPDFRSDTLLKFWLFNPTSQAYKLKTCVTSYHRINKILFQPLPEASDSSCKVRYLVATACSDHNFRIWSEVSCYIKSGSWRTWSCESVGRYREHPLNDMCFSSDGSVLGVAFGPCTTVWDVETNRMKCRFISGRDHIRKIEFCSGESSFVIISADSTRLYAWNLLTCSLLYCVMLDVSLLVAHPFSSHVAVFTRNNNLHVYKFSFAGVDEVYRNDDVCKDSNVLSAVYCPLSNSEDLYNLKADISWLYNAALYFFTSKQELFAIEEKTKVNLEQSVVMKERTFSPFKGLFTAQASSDVKEHETTRETAFATPDIRALMQFLNFPAHTMPPIHLLSTAVLQSLLISKPIMKENGKQREEDTEPAILY